MSGPLETVCWPFKSRDPCIFLAPSCYEQQVLKCLRKEAFRLKDQIYTKVQLAVALCAIFLFLSMSNETLYWIATQKKHTHTQYKATEIFSKKRSSSQGCTRWNHTIFKRVRYMGVCQSQTPILMRRNPGESMWVTFESNTFLPLVVVPIPQWSHQHVLFISLILTQALKNASSSLLSPITL